jgi:heptose I phosphotransferase
MNNNINNLIVILDEPFRSLWAGRDPFVAVEALSGEVFRELEARRTLRTEAAGKSYFVKIHRGIGWAEIVKNLLCLRLPVLGAGNEWQAIKRLEQLGVDTLRGVAFGQRGQNPATQHSFIVTEDLAPTVSLEDFCRDWPTHPPALAMKRALLRRVADMAQRMHQGGVNHRDFYLCHFLLHLDPAPVPENLKLSLIDLHRAQIRQKTPRRWRDKDLAALYFSALNIGLTRRDVLRFLRLYFDRPLRAVFRDETTLPRLADEVKRLHKRYLRKAAEGSPL